ncbi:hypothetical protein Vau01_023170 [Virgisporangium aurantiacum]|uniref:Uncharacterized protein n=2 Tax=Virgisporangium aurantiacum TaxID=175570 RepID=A0A8J3Z3W9_9ACTN|nr:hypothetical protein Vau01_023170 [Virgisporangium aurantiacum]
MYAVELRFIPTETGILPSVEVMEASVRLNGTRAGRQIEHVVVRTISIDIYFVIFALAHDVDDARRLARSIGAAVAVEFAQVRFDGFRVWRRERA